MSEFQKNDLKVVLSYLRSNEKVSRIGLWGRSMGAVTRLVIIIRSLSLKIVQIFSLCIVLSKLLFYSGMSTSQKIITLVFKYLGCYLVVQITSVLFRVLILYRVFSFLRTYNLFSFLTFLGFFRV